MPLASTREIVERARARDVGVGSFNVITLEHAEAVVTGAERTGEPVIMQISENAVRFHHGRLLPIAAAVVAVARAASVPVAVHLDHVEDETLLQQVMEADISSVMFDASTLDYRHNLEATRSVATWARAHGIYLEAELGEVGGKDGAHAPGARTDPVEAAAFVENTGVDALAVAVGSSHAMTQRTATLDHDLIGALRRAVPVPLVLHGSSGVPDAELSRAVAAGITKVNIGTILNVAYTTAVRDTLAADDRLVDPRTYLAVAKDRMSDTVARLLHVLAEPS